MSKYDDCEIGRKMEMNVAKMQKDIEYIKEETKEVKCNLKTILIKLNNMDRIYAKQTEFDDMKKEFNWVKKTAITSIIGVIGSLITVIFFLIKYIFFT